MIDLAQIEKTLSTQFLAPQSTEMPRVPRRNDSQRRKTWICCIGCNPPRDVSYYGWSQHCENHHNDVDQSSKDGVADQTDIVQPAVNDAESAKEPKKRYGTREPKAAAPKPCEPKANPAASKRRNIESAGDQGTQDAKRAKSKLAAKKNLS